jgi:para-aminobenzoate synthetase component 1
VSSTRYRHVFPIAAYANLHQRLLEYGRVCNYFVYLDSNEAPNATYQKLIGVGAIDVISCNSGNALDNLYRFHQNNQDWVFGYLGYDLKNELEDLTSDNSDILQFPDLQFFIPELVIEFNRDIITFHSRQADRDSILKFISELSALDAIHDQPTGGVLTAVDSKNQYLAKAQQFLDHIQRGDIYEANLCTAFQSNQSQIDPVRAFKDLNEISKPPFATYARFEDHHVISASPERYLQKRGQELRSQPIKGTAARSQDVNEDEQLKKQLFDSQKERSENVMIVDLVRNDFSRVASRGSVQVPELHQIHTFKQVHHLISMVTAQLQTQYTWMDTIKASFPMGSMTGAPKISAMKIIEDQESFKRGIYSGAIGYIDPDGDLDFNVVIRTILYNHNLKTLSISVGSAITASAQPAAEYKECFLKAKALLDILKKQGVDFA